MPRNRAIFFTAIRAQSNIRLRRAGMAGGDRGLQRVYGSLPAVIFRRGEDRAGSANVPTGNTPVLSEQQDRFAVGTDAPAAKTWISIGIPGRALH